MEIEIYAYNLIDAKKELFRKIEHIDKIISYGKKKIYFNNEYRKSEYCYIFRIQMQKTEKKCEICGMWIYGLSAFRNKKEICRNCYNVIK